MLEIVLAILLSLALTILIMATNKVVDLNADIKIQKEMIRHQNEMIKLQTELSQNYKQQFEIAKKYGDDLYAEHIRFLHDIERRMY